MKVRVFEKPDGSIVLRVPVMNADAGPQKEILDQLRADGKTEDEVFDAVCNIGKQPGTARADIDTATLQASHEHFKAARRWNGSAVVVDMTEARAIHMDAIREKRNAELDVLDKEYSKESGRKRVVEAEAIEAKRETLRNVPDTFDLSGARDPESLKALWPTDVPR